MLNKNDILFERNEQGELIPQEVVLELLEVKETIKAIPLTRGKIQEIHAKSKSENLDDKLESDNEIIRCGLVEPKLSEDEIKSLKPKFAGAISMAILSLSLDIPQKEINNRVEKTINGIDLELKKK